MVYAYCLGSKREHSKSGCRICGSQCKVETIGSNPCNCLWHVEETHRKETEVEDKIIQQASQVIIIIGHMLQMAQLSEQSFCFWSSRV